MNFTKIFHPAALLCTAIALISSDALAAKIYKWVDQNGEVHYSQTPPKPKDSVAKENVESLTTARTIAPSKQGEYEYCGKMRLPGPYYDSKQILRNLDRQVQSWQEAIGRLEKQYSVNNQLRELDQAKRNEQYKRYAQKSGYNYNSQTDYQSQQRQENNRRIAEYRCAIAWSDSKKTELSDLKKELSYDVKRAKLSYQDALEAAQKECGFEPNDFSHPLYREKEKIWQNCMKPHRSTLRSLKHKMERAISAAGDSRAHLE